MFDSCTKLNHCSPIRTNGSSLPLHFTDLLASNNPRHRLKPVRKVFAVNLCGFNSSQVLLLSTFQLKHSQPSLYAQKTSTFEKILSWLKMPLFLITQSFLKYQGGKCSFFNCSSRQLYSQSSWISSTVSSLRAAHGSRLALL